MDIFPKTSLFLLLIVAISLPTVYGLHCNDTQSSKACISMQYPLNSSSDSLKLLPLCIRVDLTPKAKELIVATKERMSISVEIDFSEEDFIENNPFQDEFEEFGVLNIYSKIKTISYGEIACFEDIRVSRKLYDSLLSKKIIAYVFCFSSQEVIQQNVLLPTNSLEIDMLTLKPDSIFTINVQLITDNC